MTVASSVIGDAIVAARPLPDEVRAQMRRILADPTLQASPARRDLLRFVVEETLAGRADRLKGVAIALAVFGRKDDFDPQTDPVVRVEARRLRRDLNTYYVSTGKVDPVIISIPKGGYVPHFEWRQEKPQPLPEVTENVRPGATQPEPAGRQKWSFKRSWLTAAAILAVVVGSALLVPHLLSKQQAQPSTSDDPILAMPRGPSIAVLPFLNLSSDPAKQYFSVGIAEQLATELAHFRNIRVLWLGSTRTYKDGFAQPQALHRDLGADFVLEGSLRATSDTVHITARLINAQDARQLWVKSLEAPLVPARIYEVQDAIAREVTGNVAGKYGFISLGYMERAKRKAPESVDAYDCVLRYYDYQITIDPERRAEIKACLERAVELDPEFAEAWAVLANVYMQEKRFGAGGHGASETPVPKAKAAAHRAIALDPTEPTGHIVLSNLRFTEGDIEGFKEAGEHALGLNPNDTDLLGHFGLRLAIIGEWDRGRALVGKAMAINPAHPHWYRFAEALYRYDRQEYDLALAELEKIDMPRFFWSHMMRAAVLAQLGRTDEAEAAVGELLALKPNFSGEALERIRMWQFPEPFVRHLVQGLSKAGLAISPAPPAS